MDIDPIIEQIIDKYLELRSQGMSHKEIYEFILLQGYPKESVDHTFNAIELSDAMLKEIGRMKESGLSPKEVYQVLVNEGYPEALISKHMEPYL